MRRLALLLTVLCGGCPERTSSPRYADPPSGPPVMIASGLGQVTKLATDPDGVVFADLIGMPTVGRVPKAGGDIFAIVPAANVVVVAVDESWVYWPERYAGEVRRVPPSGGESTLLGAVQPEVDAIAVDGDEVFVGIQPLCVLGEPCPTTQQLIVRFPTAGGPGVPIYEVTAGQGHRIWEIALDADSVYWVEDYLVMKAPRAGGAAVELAGSAVGQTLNLALSDDHVYYATSDTVLRVSKAGGTAETLAAGQDNVRALTTDSAGVYWITTDALRFVAHGGGEIIDVATSLSQPSDVVADSSGVYFATGPVGSPPDAGPGFFPDGALGAATGAMIWKIPR